MINQNITFSPALSALGVQQRPIVTPGRLGNTKPSILLVVPVVTAFAGAKLARKHALIGGLLGAAVGFIGVATYTAVSALKNLQ